MLSKIKAENRTLFIINKLFSPFLRSSAWGEIKHVVSLRVYLSENNFFRLFLAKTSPKCLLNNILLHNFCRKYFLLENFMRSSWGEFTVELNIVIKNKFPHCYVGDNLLKNEMLCCSDRDFLSTTFALCWFSLEFPLFLVVLVNFLLFIVCCVTKISLLDSFVWRSSKRFSIFTISCQSKMFSLLSWCLNGGDPDLSENIFFPSILKYLFCFGAQSEIFRQESNHLMEDENPRFWNVQQ